MTNPLYVTFQAIAKVDWEPFYCVAGVEFLCARMAHLVGLPCPAGGITRTAEGHAAYFSLDFTDLTVSPAPIVPTRFAAEHRRVAAGVAMFDAWVLNNDRNPDNLAVIGSGSGSSPFVFDHSHALGTGGSREAIPDLPGRVGDPLVGHCLQDVLDDGREFDVWRERINQLPPHVMLPHFEQVIALGVLTEAEAQTIFDFLVKRRDHLIDCVTPLFHNVQNWPM
ncbi:MAG: hypothetical protein CL424_10930 [Acidimicrobiaceae bacterium]|nr:hypothetical protein [Acidimicrobiaceae bacterium]